MFVISADGGRGPLLVDPPAAEAPHGLGIAIGRTKTTGAEDDEFLVFAGRAQLCLKDLARRAAAGNPGRPHLPHPRPLGNFGAGGVSGHAVNTLLKQRAARAGLDPAKTSALELLAGYLTEASLRGVPIEAAMRHSMHRSVQSAVRHRDRERGSGKAARLAG